MSREDNVLVELKNILEEVKVWLHFGEAKHGALLAINLVLIFKCTDFFINIKENKIIGNKVFLMCIMSLYIVSTIISFISFMPKLNKLDDSDVCENEINITNNLLNFFGDIKSYNSSKLYLRDIYKKYFDIDRIKDFPLIELDYAKEIIINSQITNNKFKLFKLCVIIDILATIMLLVFWVGNVLNISINII
ncbi:MAG: hypothetical protein MJH09_12760 [Cetobacterium sp.]|nr:hypothetical protein [Cetobacterium sp.]